MQKIVAKLYLLVFITLLLFTVSARHGRFLGISLRPESKTATRFVSSDVRQIFPMATTTVEKSIDEAAVLDKNGTKIGVLIHTLPITNGITGYSTSLPILVGLDSQQKVVGIVLQENNETPGFIKHIEKSGFFNTWDGLAASEVVNLDFDAVSRATLTSQATIDSLKLRLGKYLALKRDQEKTDWRKITLEILAWVFLLITLMSCAFPSKMAKYRTLILVAAVIIPGFLLGRFISIELIRSWALSGIPFAAQPYLALVMMLAFVLPLVTGKTFYCCWFCPYGAAQELLGKVFKRKFNLTGNLLQFCRWLRVAFLMAIVFLLLIGVDMEVSRLEPFTLFLYRSAADSVIVLAVVFLFLSLFIRKPWCNYVCPSGQLIEVVRTYPINAPAKNISEVSKMKIQEVVSLLLVIAVVILFMAPVQTENTRDLKVPEKSADAKVGAMSQNSAKDVSRGKIILENIFSRKSVRSFTGKKVGNDILGGLVKAGMAAPTARNQQPWQFVVIDNGETLQKLAEQLPYAKMLASAGAAIVVCGDLEIAKAGGTERMWVQDCAAATENILLAAEGMGLGAVWTAAYPYEDRMSVVVEALSLPEHIIPLNVIPVGYPDGADKPKDKWRPERLHWNTFGTTKSEN